MNVLHEAYLMEIDETIIILVSSNIAIHTPETFHLPPMFSEESLLFPAAAYYQQLNNCKQS